MPKAQITNMVEKPCAYKQTMKTQKKTAKDCPISINEVKKRDIKQKLPQVLLL